MPSAVTVERSSPLAAVTIFAARHRLPSTSAVVLQDGSNLSVHLAPSPVVVRVATFAGHIRVDPLPWLEREVALATYLASIGASVMAPSDLVPVGPHVIDGWALTAWRYVEHVPGLVPETWASFAALDELHEAMRGFSGDLPAMGPVTDDLDRALSAGLRDEVFGPSRIEEWRGRRDELLVGLLAIAPDRQALHGDAFPRNSLVRPDGRIVWIDFEDCCSGPVLWDLGTLVRQGEPDPEVEALIARRYGTEALQTAVALRQVQLEVWKALHEARRSKGLELPPE